MRVSIGKRAAAVTAGLAAATALVVVPTSASAAPKLNVAYDASGSSTIAKPGATITLGPTTLTAALNSSTGAFSGTLPLPPTAASFKVLGLVPISGTVSFTQLGKVYGKLKTKGTRQSVSGKVSYSIGLSNVKVAGIPTSVGNSCATADPVVISFATPAGDSFNITSGGTVTGSYTIGDFANCGLLTGALNLLVPGSGNTLSVTLANGRIIT